MNKQKGFTLIELLVAMGIIAVLTGMAAFNFNQSRVRARDVQRKSDLSQLQKAMELYKNDNDGSYPDKANYQSTLLGGEYIKSTFNDPKGSEWKAYTYEPAAVGLKTYYLMACLENPADSTKTTDTTICQNFTSDTTDICGCGISTKTGAMYIISNP